MLAIIPAWEAWGEIGGAVLVIVLFATSLLYALHWVPALLLHRLQPLRGSGLYLSVRGLPLAGVLLLLATFGVLALAGDDAIRRLGNVTVWSVSVCARLAHAPRGGA